MTEPSTMASQYRIELTDEDGIPEMVKLIVPSFAQYSVEAMMGNVDTPEAIAAATQRHLRAEREHKAEAGRSSAIKCIETTSGEGKMVACAYWLVFDQARSPANARKRDYLFSAEWLPEGERRERALRAIDPVVETREKWTVGRPHAILTYMATDTEWRRKGAATACVKWGLDLCRRLGIIAYLEASEQGAPLYTKLGFEVVDHMQCDVDGEVSSFPAMIWWPPGTKDEDKRPLEA